jgi:hypothetical protein
LSFSAKLTMVVMIASPPPPQTRMSRTCPERPENHSGVAM